MTTNGLLQTAIYLIVLLLLVEIGRLVHGEGVHGTIGLLDRFIGPFERWIYRVCLIQPEREMTWKQYAGRCCCSTRRGGFSSTPSSSPSRSSR